MEIINLDMTPSTVTPNAHAGQYDSARTVRFMLKNCGTPYTLAGTETITAEITRSDNTEVTVNVTNTSSNYVDVVFDDTVCTVKGLYACELRLKDSDGFDIGSKNFALLVQRDPYDGQGVSVETVGPADICTFETTLAEPLQSVLVNVLATGGNGTPDNPNPISGYTEANITRCGVNFFDKSTVTIGRIINGGGNDVSFTGWNVSDYIPVKEGAEFYLYGLTTHPNTNQDNFIFFNASKTKIGFANVKTWEYPLTIPSGTKFVKCTCSDTDLNTAQFSLTNNAPYEPYNGQTYTIAFGQTVYGGVLDVTRGKLTVTHQILEKTTASMNNDENFPGWRFSGIRALVGAGLNVTYFNQILNIGTEFSVNTNGSNDELYLRTSTYGLTQSQWITQYPDLTIQICVELATPFDIDLTPEVISAIVGTNNVFAGCGETTVKYLKAGE